MMQTRMDLGDTPIRTYGNLRMLMPHLHHPAYWQIEYLEPHVAMAFKRLFKRIPETATVMKMQDTDEIRADILWFMARYPLAHDPRLMAELIAGEQRIKSRMAERNRILLPEWTPPADIGFKAGEKPFLYQSQAAQITLNNPGLLLADDVGLGKTITAAATLTMGAPLPAAVVVEAHLPFQWDRQFLRFTNLRAHVISSRTPYNLPPADVYFFRYSNISGWSDVIAKGLFKTVIWDEIQQLRHGTGTSKGVASMALAEHAQVKMGLTATPIYNYGDEIHNIMEFIRPGLLGSRYEFMREWCGGGRIVKDPDALGSFLSDTGFFLRRDEDDETVDQSMPPPNVIVLPVDFDPDAVQKEIDITRQLAMTVLNGQFAEAGQAARDLDMKMRQLTGIAKAPYVAAYVKMLLQEAPCVLLAGWHREVYSIWQEHLAEFNPVLYTGSETGAGKERSKRAFIAGESRVMMMSLRSGAGLDGLQHVCQDAVVGELDWSPQVHYQFVGRVRRPGQQSQVNAHFLHTNFGSDPVLMEMNGIKSDQSRGILRPGKGMRAQVVDESRIKKLARFVLERT